MPRMQVYLPDELHAAVKEHGLPASELLQAAVRAELRRRDLQARVEEVLERVRATGAEPTDADRDRAELLARRLAARARY